MITLVVPEADLRVVIDALAFAASRDYAPEFPPRRRVAAIKLKDELAALLR